MEVSGKIVGSELAPLRHELSWRRMMNYAAAVEDFNPLYFDDERPDGVIAPPMLAVALTWPIMERISHHLAGVDIDPAVVQTQVHHTEHLRFYRPMRDGDQIVITGRVAAVLPHRAGVRLVLRLEARGHDGELVFVEHIGGLLRGVGCQDGPAGQDDLPQTPAAPEAGAQPLWRAEIAIDALRAHVYDGCTGIHFPIHTSPRFARLVGLPGVILQGTATLAYAVRELINRQAAGQAQRLESLSCRFVGMTRPGRAITARLLARRADAAGDDLFFDVLDADGQTIIRDGHARLRP